jgi:hypothetical protein
MSSEKQMNANRLNAQKSTGPKTSEGKVIVAQNALKHGLFAHENVVKCEKQSDFDYFREELLSGLAPVGGVEAMVAERIVSLSWRLKRIERMNSEAIDVMIAKSETGLSERRQRREAGLLDAETGRSELVLGWATIDDFKYSHVLERLLLYEKRIECSLYKAMGELQKLQSLREQEQSEVAELEQAIPPLGKNATRSEDEMLNSKKQSQFSLSANSANPAVNEKTNPVADLLIGDSKHSIAKKGLC